MMFSPSSNRRSTRVGRSGGGMSRSKKRSTRVKLGKAQKWVQVKRPPAPGLGFCIPTWVPLAELTESERLGYEKANTTAAGEDMSRTASMASLTNNSGVSETTTDAMDTQTGTTDDDDDSGEAVGMLVEEESSTNNNAVVQPLETKPNDESQAASNAVAAPLQSDATKKATQDAKPLTTDESASAPSTTDNENIEKVEINQQESTTVTQSPEIDQKDHTEVTQTEPPPATLEVKQEMSSEEQLLPPTVEPTPPSITDKMETEPMETSTPEQPHTADTTATKMDTERTASQGINSSLLDAATSANSIVESTTTTPITAQDCNMQADPPTTTGDDKPDNEASAIANDQKPTEQATPPAHDVTIAAPTFEVEKNETAPAIPLESTRPTVGNALPDDTQTINASLAPMTKSEGSPVPETAPTHADDQPMEGGRTNADTTTMNRAAPVSAIMNDPLQMLADLSSHVAMEPTSSSGSEQDKSNSSGFVEPSQGDTRTTASVPETSSAERHYQSIADKKFVEEPPAKRQKFDSET